ncbi:protein FAM117B-like [Amphiura filiformis]|uniref:protein FAM117B-like n=1 Tax=Amphiura filiformis TaxID=82378 RepID=UPI003B22313D
MAAQPPQRPQRRNASPRAGPQPMRATLPFTLRQSSPIRGSNGRRSSPGPASSPTQPWPDNHKKHSRRSPDHRASPERSPSTPGFKVEKPKAVKASQIRRTSSLDTIYLSGHWPRQETSSSGISYGPYGPNQKHQSTQTDEVDRKGSSHKRSSSWGSSDNLKEKLKQQLRKQNSRNHQSSTTNQRASPVHGNHSTAHYSSPSPSSSTTSTTSTSTNTTPTAATQTEEPPPPAPLSTSRSTSTAIPVPTLKAPSTSPRIRGSVEGLNQEIETLVLRGFPNEHERPSNPGPTPEGHRGASPTAVTLHAASTPRRQRQTIAVTMAVAQRVAVNRFRQLSPWMGQGHPADQVQRVMERR